MEVNAWQDFLAPPQITVLTTQVYAFLPLAPPQIAVLKTQEHGSVGPWKLGRATSDFGVENATTSVLASWEGPLYSRSDLIALIILSLIHYLFTLRR